MKDKKDRFTITTELLPEDIYEILNEKSKQKALSSFIVELIQYKKNTQTIIDKLNKIENKIDFMCFNGSFAIKKNCDNQENAITDIENNSLEEEIQQGDVIKAKKVVSKINKADLEENYDL